MTTAQQSSRAPSTPPRVTGAGYAEHCTLEDVGRELGISRERVRQIEQRALRKLARWLRARGYRAEDFL